MTEEFQFSTTQVGKAYNCAIRTKATSACCILRLKSSPHVKKKQRRTVLKFVVRQERTKQCKNLSGIQSSLNFYKGRKDDEQ